MPLSEVFLLAVALAVSAIPEGLPVALTVALAIGMRRMARRNVIVRRLVAVEALGSCTFIATDKTGTLTVNQLTARRIVFPARDAWEVTGESLQPAGAIVTPRGAPSPDEQALLKRLCQAAVLPNEGFLGHREQGLDPAWGRGRRCPVGYGPQGGGHSSGNRRRLPCNRLHSLRVRTPVLRQPEPGQWRTGCLCQGSLWSVCCRCAARWRFQGDR